MNQAFRNLLVAQVAGAVSAARALGPVEHSGLKGALREIILRSLLRPLLPPNIGLGHGVVVTAFDQQSTEQDVIIFNRNSVPSLILDGENGLFPLEAVLFTVEVKSVLTSTELHSAHGKAKKLTSLSHVPGDSPPEHIIPCLFAFDTDIKDKDELDRYKGIAGNEPPLLRAICVVGRGYWYWRDDHGWITNAASPEYAEVLALVAGVLAVHERVITSRAKPDLLEYTAQR